MKKSAAFANFPPLHTRKISSFSLFTLISLLLVYPTAQGTDILEHKVLVSGSANFRDISLHTWKGIPRIGVPDNKGLAGPVAYGQELGKAIKKNEVLARQLGESLERHNYSLGLLSVLDYMRVNADCFTNIDKYEARVESCGGTLIRHSAQLGPWEANVRNMAMSLVPEAHGKLFCQHAKGKSGCAATHLDHVSVKNDKGGVLRLDEFQRRDFFSQLMREHQSNFEKLWKSSHFPDEAWLVQVVTLNEYDFDKQRYVFNLLPASSFTSRQYPLVQTGKPSKGGALQSRMFALSPQYKATSDFEKGTALENHRRIKVLLPMDSTKARAVGRLQKRRAFYAVTKIRFLPRGKLGALAQASGPLNLAFHYAENKVQLYQDASLSKKVAEVPITKVVATSTKETTPKADWRWAEGHQIFDNRAYALLRIKQGALPDQNLQQLANSVVQSERNTWMNHERRLEQLNHETPPAQTESQQQSIANKKRLAEDRAKLSHLNWQQMNGDQKEVLYRYMLGIGDTANQWPDAFPAVSWGMNVATIFPKGHFSTDRTLMRLPATEKDKATFEEFLAEIAQSYSTEKLTLVYNLRDISYDNQSQSIKLSWPFHIRPYIAFDDDRGQKFTSAGVPLVSARAKDRAIYPVSLSSAPLGSYVPNPSINKCRHNEKTQSEDCVTSYGHFLQANWGLASFAFDRQLTMPELKMAPVRATQLINSVKRGGPGWRLVVELENIDMTVSSFEYKARNKHELQKGEGQTIFASVKKAYILAPNDETVWQAASSQLKKPVDGSKLTADQPASFNWASPVKLFDNGQPDRALYDFLFVKYYPDLLDQRFLEAMFSSRWSYEKAQSSPTGGRFFNQEARVPTWQDVQKSLPRFKQWLTKRAARLPDRVKVLMPIRYANNTVSEHTQCIKFKLTPKSPLRNSGTAKILADRKVRECQSSERQSKSRFERCETLRIDLSTAKTALAKTEQAGCKQKIENISEEAVKISATGSCDFSNIDFSKMQAAAMACMAERCGSTPTTMANMATYQKCVQAVSTELQTQLQAALGGGRSKPKQQPRDQIVDNCKPHQRVITNTERGLKSKQCDQHVVAPELMNCSLLGKVAEVTHMHVERLRFDQNSSCGDAAFIRKSNSSAALLPYAQPYSDTQFRLEIGLGKLEVPYDPPYSQVTPSNAILELDLDIQSVTASNQKQVMKLEATVKASKIYPKK